MIIMNYWTEQSAEFAQQRNYLDELFKVYPLNPNLRRELSDEQESALRAAYASMDNIRLIETLLDIELFPVKDSYIPFLRHDSGAILRNPQTVNRIAGSLYQMVLMLSLKSAQPQKKLTDKWGRYLRAG